MTTITINDKLVPVFQNAFQHLLDQARNDDTFHGKLKQALKKFDLLTYRQFSPFKPREIHVDQEQLADSRYRRRLIRELKAPRPSPWVYHTLSMEQKELFSGKDNNEYLIALAQYMAQNAAARLGQVSAQDALVITRMEAMDLFHFLHRFKRFELTGEDLSKFLLHELCQRIIDENPRYQAAVAMIADAAEEARTRLREEMKPVVDAAMSDFSRRMAEISAEAGSRADAFIAKLKQQQAERQERQRLEEEEQQRLAALNAGKSEEQIFAEAVKKRELAYRQANPTHPAVKVLLWGGAVLLAVGFALFGEVNGVPVLEYLGLDSE